MSEILFNTEIIKSRIPHRPPFLLIDDITTFEAHQTCTARRFVDPSDTVFAGHFPGDPVYPGVLVLEHMAQAACFLINHSNSQSGQDMLPMFGKADKVRWSAMVKPGDSLETKVILQRQIQGFSIFSAVCKVNGKRVAQCEMTVKKVASSQRGEHV